MQFNEIKPPKIKRSASGAGSGLVVCVLQRHAMVEQNNTHNYNRNVHTFKPFTGQVFLIFLQNLLQLYLLYHICTNNKTKGYHFSNTPATFIVK